MSMSFQAYGRPVNSAGTAAEAGSAAGELEESEQANNLACECYGGGGRIRTPCA